MHRAKKILSIATAVMCAVSAFAFPVSAAKVDASSWNSSWSGTVSNNKYMGKISVKGIDAGGTRVSSTSTATSSVIPNDDLLVIAHQLYYTTVDSTTSAVDIKATYTSDDYHLVASDDESLEYVSPTQESVVEVASNIASEVRTNGSNKFKDNSVVMTYDEESDSFTTSVPAGLYMVLVYNTASAFYNPIIVSVNVAWDYSAQPAELKVVDNDGLDLEDTTRFFGESTGYAKKNTVDIKKWGTDRYDIGGFRLFTLQGKLNTSAIQDEELKDPTTKSIMYIVQIPVLPDYTGYDSPYFTVTEQKSGSHIDLIQGPYTDLVLYVDGKTVEQSGNIVVTDMSKNSFSISFTKSFLQNSDYIGKEVVITYKDRDLDDDEGSNQHEGTARYHFDIDLRGSSPTMTLVGDNKGYHNPHDDDDTDTKDNFWDPEYSTSVLNYSSALYGVNAVASDPFRVRKWGEDADGEAGSGGGSYGTLIFDFTKTDSESGTGLAGATFTCGDKTFISGNDGIVTVDYLRGSSNTANFTLTETSAPAGYTGKGTINASWVGSFDFIDKTGTVTVTVDGKSVTFVPSSDFKIWRVSSNNYTRTPITVPNEKISLVNLPSTGGVGTIVFTIVLTGVLLIGFVAFVKVRNKGKTH